MNISMELQRLVDEANKREQNDDHFSDEERQKIVNMFKAENPAVVILSNNLADAYVEVICDLA